jgi:hypothetical protein
MELIFYEDASIDSDVLSITVYNCGYENGIELNDLSAGSVFAADADCEASPAIGSWECLAGPPPWSFSSDEEYDTQFFPTGYGLYEICFTEEACEQDYCYDIEITEEPSVDLSTLNDVLCNGETTTVFADLVDIGGTADLNWSAPGEDDVLSNEFSFSNPTTYNASIVVTNGCGTASASLQLFFSVHARTGVGR